MDVDYAAYSINTNNLENVPMPNNNQGIHKQELTSTKRSTKHPSTYRYILQ